MSVSVADAVAIYDLIGRYCYYVDHNGGDEWAALYTEDGEAVGMLPEPVIGRAQLRRVPIDSYERFGGKCVHQITNPMIDYGATAMRRSSRRPGSSPCGRMAARCSAA